MVETLRVTKTEQRVLAIITARGGSQGLLGKNIRPFAGKPLIAHTILAAQEAGEAITRLVLSTDCNEIARIGSEWGAEVPFRRPPDLSTAHASSLSVALHALQFMEEQDGQLYDWICLLQPTSPLRNGADILAALALVEGEASAVISVTPAGHCHPVYLRHIQDGYLQGVDATVSPDTRRQDLSVVYQINGAIYLTRRDTLVNEQSFFGARPLPYVMPRERSADIDDELDFAIAEFIHARLCATRVAHT